MPRAPARRTSPSGWWPSSPSSSAADRGDTTPVRGQPSGGQAPLPARSSVPGRGPPGLPAHQDAVALSGGQYAELVAVGIGHHHPADLPLPDVDPSRPEGDEALDLRLLIPVRRWRDVEVQPVLSLLGHHGRTAPRDLRTAVRRADRRLLVLVPDHWPAQRLAPEVPDLLRTVARERSDESAVGEEVVARLDDAELIALGVGQHHMALLRALTDVDVPGAEFERPRHRLLLVLEGRARQVDMHLVLVGFLLLRREEPDPEPRVIARQERDAVGGLV